MIREPDVDQRHKSLVVVLTLFLNIGRKCGIFLSFLCFYISHTLEVWAWDSKAENELNSSSGCSYIFIPFCYMSVHWPQEYYISFWQDSGGICMRVNWIVTIVFFFFNFIFYLTCIELSLQVRFITPTLCYQNEWMNKNLGFGQVWTAECCSWLNYTWKELDSRETRATLWGSVSPSHSVQTEMIVQIVVN